MYAVVFGKRSSSIFADELLPQASSPTSHHNHSPAPKSSRNSHHHQRRDGRDALLQHLRAAFPAMYPQKDGPFLWISAARSKFVAVLGGFLRRFFYGKQGTPFHSSPLDLVARFLRGRRYSFFLCLRRTRSPPDQRKGDPCLLR